MDRSFKNFFNGFGYPRFQGRDRYNSFAYPQSGFKLKDGRLDLSKIGNLKITQHREIEGKIKTCTIKKDVDQWYAKLLKASEKRLAREQIHLSKKKLRSKNRNNQRITVAAKSISDAGWSQLISLTTYKAEYAGKIVELVNPHGTSQTCICGCRVPKDLSMRIHSCSHCGLVLDRDHVSAIVIESRSSTIGTMGIKARQSNLNREPMKREAAIFIER